jgi:hypothetical protein
MVALIDTPAWRLRTALVGAGVAPGGGALVQLEASVIGWTLVVVGGVLALWAWLHPTRSEFPPGPLPPP